MASPWQCSSDLVVAVLLFGATRDVTHTHASHARNVIEPLEAYWSGARGGAVGSVVDVFIHAMMMPAVHNPRAGELGKASLKFSGHLERRTGQIILPNTTALHTIEQSDQHAWRVDRAQPASKGVLNC